MGRKSQDPTVVSSSIALLQERFRQLQRVKEMREERELQKMMLNEPKQFNSNSNAFSHPELITPSRSSSPPHVSLSLWPASQDQDYRRSVQTPVSMNFCPTSTYAHAQVSEKKVCECDSGSDPGVDTSLHL